MNHIRHALLLITATALLTALALACSSDDPPSQPTTEAPAEQVQQAQQMDPPDQSQPSSPISQSQEVQEQQAAGESTDVQQPEESQAQQSVRSSSDDQETETTVSVRAEQTTQQAEDESDTQSDTDEVQQQEQPLEEAEQTAPSQPETDDEQQEPAAESVAEEDAEQDQQQSESSERERLQLRAAEIAARATVSDLVGINAWLNGEETTVALELAKGNVVLVDFWTYTCINCVRTLPFLTAWDEKYRDHGLVIIGVHTPEFEFEKRLDNVRAANAEHGVEYLVAIDNDYATWRAFQGRRGFWPRKFLIGPTADGSPMGVRYDHLGEGDYEETEVQIRAALEAVGKDLSNVPFGVDVPVPDRSDVARGVQTRELYGGWSRNVGGGGPYAGQEEYFLAGLGAEYLYRDVDPEDRLHNVWYLEGLWRAENQAIAHARTTEHLEDYMAMIVRARTVNVVLTVAEDGQPYDVYIQFNDDWVQPDFAGEHIQWDSQGRSFVRVNENDLFRLLFFEDFSEGELKLSSNSDQLRIFAFTFGSYIGGE
ncbi:MAG: redoxin domain-containing protein [Chloroflexi bacterium]|nr:redoxin domain-containing protein [Chloroflexota bacterium]